MSEIFQSVKKKFTRIFIISILVLIYRNFSKTSVIFVQFQFNIDFLKINKIFKVSIQSNFIINIIL